MSERREPSAQNAGEKKGMSTKAKWAIGCAIAAAVGLFIVVPVIAGAVMVLVPRVHDQQMKTTCADRLRQLGGAYVGVTLDEGAPRHSGSALFLDYRKRFIVQRGYEQVLTCPGDVHVKAPVSEAEMMEWESVDLTDPADVRAHCSYAARDFERHPIDHSSLRAVAVACDAPGPDGVVASHHDGLNVLYSDGSVRFRDREYFGLGPDDPITIGPDSPIEELRPLVVMPAR